MSNKIKNPHDALFKTAFRNKPVMKDWLASHLSTALKKKVDLTTLQLENSNFVDPKLKNTESDLVYSLKVKSSVGCLYVLVECESTSRRAENIPFRLLQYNLRLMRQHIQQGNGAKFPAIINLVLYTDVKPYKGAKKIIDCFEHPELFYPVVEHVFLIELNNKTIEEILKDGKASLVGLLLKYGKEKELAKLIAEKPEMMQRLMAESPYQVDALEYISEREEWLPEEVLEKFPNLAEEIKNEFMSGIQKVTQRATEQLVQNLFAAGASFEVLKKGTKIPESKLKEILGLQEKKSKT